MHLTVLCIVFQFECINPIPIVGSSLILRHALIKLTGHGNTANNNKMERINGEIRDREKTMRGLKTKETAILKGMQVYHNYIRSHEELEGKTPAEACGIKLKGENKWITLIQLIQNASVRVKHT